VPEAPDAPEAPASASGALPAIVAAEPLVAAAPPVIAPPIPGWLWLPATPPELEATPTEDPAAPVVAVPPSFADAQPTADSATTNPREKSSVTDLLFMVRLSAAQ
jgi:hypothetical protein